MTENSFESELIGKTEEHDPENISREFEQQKEEKHPYLIVMNGKCSGNLFRIEFKNDNAIFLGRDEDCNIEIRNKRVSRKHLKIHRPKQENIILKDLQSTNGTFVNGEKIHEKSLEDGDLISLSKEVMLKYSVQDRMEKEFYQKILKKANKDGLTGILNKSSFSQRFRTEFHYCKTRNQSLSLVFFDIDHFKEINDTHGHIAGDTVLKKLAEVVSKNIRPEDLFARYGGEEFIVVLRNTDQNMAYQFAERVRKLIEETHFEHEGTAINVTVSLGIATMNKANFPDAMSMIEEADNYLYRAKSMGRNQVESAYTSD